MLGCKSNLTTATGDLTGDLVITFQSEFGKL